MPAKQDAVLAHETRQEIIKEKREIAAKFLRLGELFHHVIKRELWKFGSDSFPAFCADPEIAMSPKTCYQYADLYRAFVLDGGVDADRLKAIGPGNLEVIKRRFKECPDERDELLGDAEHLSRGDLLEKMGKPRKEGPRKKSQHEIEYEAGNEYENFNKWKMAQGCCVCGEPATERSHFPKTRGAGANEAHWFGMCADCHRTFHQVGVDTFLEKYKYPLFVWIHERLMDAWDYRRERT